MINTNVIFASALFAVLITSFIIPSYSEYISPKKQLEIGVLPNDVQCRDDRILAIRDNGDVVCVRESTAKKLDWDIIATEFSMPKIPIFTTHYQNDISNESVELQSTILQIASPLPFVDDGRKQNYGAYEDFPDIIANGGIDHLERSIHHKILSYDLVIANNDNQNTTALFRSPSHEKYSINQGVGLYPEDWMPRYIPDGYRLLYMDYNYVNWVEQNDTRHYVVYYFVPNDFVLHPNVTETSLKVFSKGFSTGGAIVNTPLTKIEDNIKSQRNHHEHRIGNYGGVVDMSRDGKTVQAFEGGDDHNPNYALIVSRPNDYIQFSVKSSYLTLDELTLIFDSIMK